jgi:FolB domain-containing protein
LCRRAPYGIIRRHAKGALGGEIVEIQTTVESETDALLALDEAKASGVDALVVFLGNFGPEGPETLMAQRFAGPTMFAAAAEENIPVLSARRGDAYCGMLNASYNLKLRGVTSYIPEYPVGDAQAVAKMIADFLPVARAIIGVNPDERTHRQDVVVNLDLEVDIRPAARSDDVADAVDYSTVAKAVQALVEGSSYQLLERLAAEIARVCLQDERVLAARVRVDKPRAVRTGRSAAVEIVRRRGEDVA